MNQETGPSGPSIEEDDEISLLDLLQVVVENLRLLVLGPLVAGLVALGMSYQIPPTYTAKTVFMPPQQQLRFTGPHSVLQVFLERIIFCVNHIADTLKKYSLKTLCLW